MLITAFAWYGLLETVFSMAAYFYVNALNGWPGVPLAASGPVYEQATTMTLAAIVFCQVGAVLNCRTDHQSLFRVGLFSNRQVLVGIAVEIALLAAIMYVPFLQDDLRYDRDRTPRLAVPDRASHSDGAAGRTPQDRGETPRQDRTERAGEHE